MGGGQPVFLGDLVTRKGFKFHHGIVVGVDPTRWWYEVTVIWFTKRHTIHIDSHTYTALILLNKSPDVSDKTR